MMDAKQLKKLAAACRKAGIKQFTSPEFSFTLTDETPILRAPRSHKPMLPLTKDAEVDVPTLTEEQMLFWSSGDITGESS